MTPRPSALTAPPNRLRPAALLAVLIAGCTHVPGLDDPLPANIARARYPQLAPLPPSLFAVQPPEEASAEIEEDLAARAGRLQARAEALRRRPLDDAAGREDDDDTAGTDAEG
ncbi:hypothetical protein [Chachezhania sediminis]|uniref:hypothetical protein n=1 Tax=Chachezhania sediminis TaxID=2599291 RepID=UPI00131E73E4|nr:hypothetical protein [Chachezhania sediminis]